MSSQIPTLCIPRVFANIKEERIRKIFEELMLGSIDKIDIIPADKDGKFNRVYVHFRTWAHNDNAILARIRLDEGKEIKIIYDDPWFWKVSLYRRHAKPVAQSAFKPRGPTIEFDCDDEIKYANRQTSKEFIGSYQNQQPLQNKYHNNAPRSHNTHHNKPPAKETRESYTNNKGLPVAKGLQLGQNQPLRARSPTGPPPINIALANSVPARLRARSPTGPPPINIALANSVPARLRARSPTGLPPINIALANSVPAKKLPLSPHSPKEAPPPNRAQYQFPVVIKTEPETQTPISTLNVDADADVDQEDYKNNEDHKIVKPVEFDYATAPPAPIKKKLVILE